MLTLIFKYIAVVIGLGQGTKPLTALRTAPEGIYFVGQVIHVLSITYFQSAEVLRKIKTFLRSYE